MTDDIDFETLSAYVDGELPEDERRQVERALAADPVKRSEVRRLREGTTLVRAAFNETLTADPPQVVVEAINAAATDKAPHSWAVPLPRPVLIQAFWPAALAASVVAIIVGLTTSYLVTDYRVEQRIAQLAAGKYADQAVQYGTLSAALEKQVSGESLAWINPDTGTSGLITLVRTFKSKAGLWCREYTSVSTREEQGEGQRGIACREPGGIWKTRAVLYEDS